MPISCAKRRRGAITAVAAPRPAAATKRRRERLGKLTLFMVSPIWSVVARQQRSRTESYCARRIYVRDQLGRSVSSTQFHRIECAQDSLIVAIRRRRSSEGRARRLQSCSG